MNSGMQPGLNGLERARGVTRTVLFWIVMLVVAVVFYHMAGAKTVRVSAISYNDLTAQIEKGNVASAVFAVGQTTTTLRVVLRSSSEATSVTLANALIPEVTDELKKNSVPMTFKSESANDLLSLAVNFAPLFLIVAFWLFMMSKMRKKQLPSNPS
jgi:cell division protease FtsH